MIYLTARLSFFGQNFEEKFSDGNTVYTSIFEPGAPDISRRGENYICMEDGWRSDDLRWNHSAKQFACEWFQSLEKTNHSRLLGEMHFIRTCYQTVGFVKTALFYKRSIYPSLAGKKIVLFDDKSYWSKALGVCLMSDGISFKKISVTKTSAKSFRLIRFKKKLKKIIRRLTQARKETPQQAVLVSANPKFVDPWIHAQKSPTVYFTDEWSYQIEKKTRENDHFFQFTLPRLRIKPESFLKRPTVRDLKSFFPTEIHTYVENLFHEFYAEFLQIAPHYRALAEAIQSSLNVLKPSRVVCDEDATPFHLVLIRLAQARKIPTVQIQHGIMGPNTLVHPVRCDWIAVTGPVAASRLKTWGNPAQKIISAGMFYETQTPAGSAMSSESIQEKELTLVLATHPIRANAKEDWFGASDNAEDVMAMLEIAVNALKQVGGWKLIVKLHPRDASRKRVEDFLRQRLAGARFQVDQETPSSVIISEANLVLCGLSTFFYESLLRNRPVWVLDHANTRQTDFLTNDFLNLSDPEGSAVVLADILNSPDRRRQRLEQQLAERKEHLFDYSSEVVLAAIANLTTEKGGGRVL